MSKMPEQIWALLEPEWEDGDGEQFVGGTWDAGRFKEGAQYTRADTAAAQVAAAYERAANLCVDQFQAHLDLVITGNLDNARNRESAASMAEKLSHEIRALATDTQTNALEQVRRDAERAGYERGARLARNMALIEAAGKCDVFDGPVSESEFVNGQSTAAQQIRAAILSLMTPDEQTEAAQELALRKAVSS